MRLPADTALIILGPGDAAEPEAVVQLRHAWNAEGLPVVEAVADFAFSADGLETRLEAFGATTLVICGAAAPGAMAAAVRSAVALGYRLFVVAEASMPGLCLEGLPPDSVRIASLQATLQASQAANFRRRWRAARDNTV